MISSNKNEQAFNPGHEERQETNQSNNDNTPLTKAQVDDKEGMERVKKALLAVKLTLTTDWNLVRLARYTRLAAREVRWGSGRYLMNKVPIVQWIALYKPSWLFSDLISGTTVGVVLTLQAVNLSATSFGAISTQQTLMASWLPGFIYAVMGTSKHISIGPTTTGTLLSLQLIGPLSAATQVPPFVLLPVLTFCVSLWFLAFGILGLGFLLDLIPISICLALVTGLALNAIVTQVPTLLGLNGIPPILPAIPPAVLANLTNISAKTLAVSLSAIVFLALLRFLNIKWGGRRTAAGRAVRVAHSLAPLFVLAVLTTVSLVLLRNLPLAQQIAPALPPPPPPGAVPAAAAQLPPPPPPPPSDAGGPVPAPQAALSNATGAPPAMHVPPQLRGTPASKRAAMAGRRQTISPRFGPGVHFPSGRLDPVGVRSAGSSSSRDREWLPAVAGRIAVTAAPPPPPPPPPPKLPFWAVFPPFATSIVAPLPPIVRLVPALLLPSFLVFLSLNLEHIVVARVLGHYHGYTVSHNQEMVAAGVANLANVFFGGVPVGGGDMGRAAVLAATGARSPLGQLFAGVVVVAAASASLAAGVLRFAPQAALAAVVVVAVYDQMPPQMLMNTYFVLSFADFVAFFLAFNIAVALPASGTAVGAGVGVGVLVMYTLFRLMFSFPTVVASPTAVADATTLPATVVTNPLLPQPHPQGTLVMRLQDDLVWVNAERVRREVVTASMVHHSGAAVEQVGGGEAVWNYDVHEKVARARARHAAFSGRRHRSSSSDSRLRFRPRLRVVVLDMAAVSLVDSSGVMSLDLMKRQLREWAGDTVEFRFVGLDDLAKKRFQRAKWHLVDPYAGRDRAAAEGAMSATQEVKGSKVPDLMFDYLSQAVAFVSQDCIQSGVWEKVGLKMSEKGDAMDEYQDDEADEDDEDVKKDFARGKVAYYQRGF